MDKLTLACQFGIQTGICPGGHEEGSGMQKFQIIWIHLCRLKQKFYID